MATTTSIATLAGTTDGNNATADDGTFTPPFGTSSINQQWKFGTTGTSLSIPSGATINGIEINCEVNTNSFGVAPEAKIKSDTGHLSFSSAKTANSWPTGKGNTVINNCWGGSTDLWGLSWSATTAASVMCEIDFSTMTSGRVAFFDYFSVTIYYTAAASGYGNDVNGVASANIGKVDGVATANIEKIIGV
jgi:hypothetical protein